MIFTSPKRLRTTAWTINKNKKSQKAEGERAETIQLLPYQMRGRFGINSGIRRVAKTASDITAVDYSGSDYEDNDITDWTGAPPIDVELLTPNSWSRPQTRLKKVFCSVIHYTANPVCIAMQNRVYF